MRHAARWQVGAHGMEAQPYSAQTKLVLAPRNGCCTLLAWGCLVVSCSGHNSCLVQMTWPLVGWDWRTAKCVARSACADAKITHLHAIRLRGMCGVGKCTAARPAQHWEPCIMACSNYLLSTASVHQELIVGRVWPAAAAPGHTSSAILPWVDEVPLSAHVQMQNMFIRRSESLGCQCG